MVFFKSLGKINKTLPCVRAGYRRQEFSVEGARAARVRHQE